MNEQQLRKRIRIWIIIFIAGLVLSGVTAFPIETELAFMVRHSGIFPDFLARWISTIYNAVKDTNVRYPWLAMAPIGWRSGIS